MIGKNIIELQSVDSTNTFAGRLADDNDFADGTVVWAHEQYAGRGLHDHTWSSEPGSNLTMTICLKPRFLPPQHQFRLNKVIALGVLDFIRSVIHAHKSMTGRPSPVDHHEISIKWPNDLYIGNRKTGGILIEHRIMGATLDTTLAGIGLNLNQAIFDPSIPNPVSLFLLLGHETDVRKALASLCGFVNQRYLVLGQPDMVQPDMEFDQSLLGYNCWRSFLRDGNELEGRIRGVDQAGRLVVETRNQGTLFFGHKEIEYIL